MQQGNAFSKGDAKWWPLVLEWLKRVLLRDDLELALITIADTVEHVVKHLAHDLPGGQKKRVMGDWHLLTSKTS
jgi:ABC-type glutathione transport system ATPase component